MECDFGLNFKKGEADFSLVRVVEHQDISLFSRSLLPDCGADGDLKSSFGCLVETASSAVSSGGVSGVCVATGLSGGFSTQKTSDSSGGRKVRFHCCQMWKD